MNVSETRDSELQQIFVYTEEERDNSNPLGALKGNCYTDKA